MRTNELGTPDTLPILSRGKHRTPRKGACFMEMASYLAGERWSDHPACTHPLLATVARCVNDYTSDEARSRLAVLIPSVIGLTSEDPRVDARVALLCARAALPVAAADRQRVMAVAVISCERVLNELEGRPHEHLDEDSRVALDDVPHATRWAERYVQGHEVSLPGFRRHAAPSIVTDAVKGIAGACIRDPDQRLHDLLVDAIDECATFVSGRVRTPRAAASWHELATLTGSAR